MRVAGDSGELEDVECVSDVPSMSLPHLTGWRGTWAGETAAGRRGISGMFWLDRVFMWGCGCEGEVCGAHPPFLLSAAG